MSLEYRCHKWRIVYRPEGRYGLRVKFPLMSEIQDKTDAQKIHSSFMKAWKARRIKHGRNLRLERPFRLAKSADKILTRNQKRYAKMKNDPTFILNDRMGHAIYQALQKYERRSKNGSRWEVLTGYTVEDLRKHLGKHFLLGMSWDNMGEWHIDHKTPKSAFNYQTSDDIDFKRCWALNNLRPLWSTDNQIKFKKLEKPFQPSLSLAV